MAVPGHAVNRRSGLQRGVALITALIVVSVSTIAAVAVASRQELDIRRTSNLLEADQAFAYALGVEAWAQLILERDLEDNELDHLGEGWASIIPPIPVDGGELGGTIEDLEGRFNLNNLVKDGVESEGHIRQFQRLLGALDLEPELSRAVLDWIDDDIDSRFPDGAEDDEYLKRKVPYRAGNRRLVSISELRLIKGFDARAMALIAPHVAVLPPGTKINVNTATSVVLQSLADDVSQADAEALIEARGEEGFTAINEFLQHSALAGRAVSGDLLALSSGHFLLRGDIRIGNAWTRTFTTISRVKEGAKVTSAVLMRTIGTE